jgi:hypothetical protein
MSYLHWSHVIYNKQFYSHFKTTLTFILKHT